MGASLLPIDELTQADQAAWRDLAESAVQPNPFFDPDFVLPAAASLDASRVALLVAEHGGDWIACLPVERARGWRRVPAVGLVTWKHLYCFLGTPLLRAEPADRGMRMLLEEGLGHGRFLGLDLIATEGPVHSAMEAQIDELELRPVTMRHFERAAVRRRPEPDYLALRPKHRRNFERLRRRLEEEVGGGLELRDRSREPEAWDEFLEVEASGWKGEDGTGTAFRSIGHQGFFLEVCRRLSDRGMLELVAAEAGGVTVAMLCNLVAGEEAFTFKIASAADQLAYSPGVQVEILYLDQFHANPGLKEVDSCADPANEMINRLWPDRRRLETSAIAAPGPLGAAVRPILQASASLGRKVGGSAVRKGHSEDVSAG